MQDQVHLRNKSAATTHSLHWNDYWKPDLSFIQ